MFLKNLLSKIHNLFAMRFYAAADDKACPPGSVFTGGSSALIQAGLGAASVKFKNILANIMLPFADSVSGAKNAIVIYTRVSPYNDADYASLPAGSICLQLTVVGGAVTDVDVWVKTGSSATAWSSVLLNTDTSSVLKYSGEFTTAGGDAVENITVTGMLSTDRVMVVLSSVNGTPKVIHAYAAADGQINVTLSGDPSTTHKLTYAVWRSTASA